MTSQNDFPLAKPGISLLVTLHWYVSIEAAETELWMRFQPIQASAAG